ncbi:HAMP domain-containing sensor histidine kinase [Guptibacillus hwajinpoensis]|uniref:HAMP domain-containing sensor histidine kinase n=1 Tax=Guptibacillus hwajinpoensis TaxID=208199 RepID=UPI001CFCE79A|nr:HAMP domain-containing sensor histidine kinase [Pseudalkalibacillus hwajinpoensis]WLR58968.1 ATP-binding protein [Pseudalkalibacillus hwajinpoensis]
MKKQQTQSLLHQFTSWYVWQFISALILIGIVVLGTIGFFLIDRTQDDVGAMEEKLLMIVREDDIQESLDDVLYPDHADYYVEIREGGKLLAQSRGDDETLDTSDEVSLPLFDQFIWNKEEGLFYRSDVSFTDGNIHLKVHMENEFEFIQLIFFILLFTGILSIIIGSILIYQFTKKKLRPLLNMTDEVSKIDGSSDLQKRIFKPSNPKELKELAGTFNQLLQELEEQFEREKSFVSNASHELRTPLTAFRGHLNLIKRWGKDDPTVLEKSIQALDDESNRMKHILEQMLTIARNEHLESRMENVNLTHIVERVISQFEENKEIPLIGNLEKNVTVLGDAEQLRQIAVILVENAMRYTEVGTITVDLTHDDGVVLSVSDTGIGIPKEEQSKIFSRFYRVDKNRSRETGGTGLGLSIAKELVENHQGKIQVKSEVDVGSTFTVLLPLKKVSLAPRNESS